jgi:hypothetical protein
MGSCGLPSNGISEASTEAVDFEEASVEKLSPVGAPRFGDGELRLICDGLVPSDASRGRVPSGIMELAPVGILWPAGMPSPRKDSGPTRAAVRTSGLSAGTASPVAAPKLRPDG